MNERKSDTMRNCDRKSSQWRLTAKKQKRHGHYNAPSASHEKMTWNGKCIANRRAVGEQMKSWTLALMETSAFCRSFAPRLLAASVFVAFWLSFTLWRSAKWRLRMSQQILQMASKAQKTMKPELCSQWLKSLYCLANMIPVLVPFEWYHYQ